eukprot:6874603-Pyramimonas_sp.AAC.2
MSSECVQELKALKALNGQNKPDWKAQHKSAPSHAGPSEAADHGSKHDKHLSPKMEKRLHEVSGRKVIRGLTMLV